MSAPGDPAPQVSYAPGFPAGWLPGGERAERAHEGKRAPARAETRIGGITEGDLEAARALAGALGDRHGNLIWRLVRAHQLAVGFVERAVAAGYEPEPVFARPVRAPLPAPPSWWCGLCRPDWDADPNAGCTDCQLTRADQERGRG